VSLWVAHMSLVPTFDPFFFRRWYAVWLHTAHYALYESASIRAQPCSARTQKPQNTIEQMQPDRVHYLYPWQGCVDHDSVAGPMVRLTPWKTSPGIVAPFSDTYPASADCEHIMCSGWHLTPRRGYVRGWPCTGMRTVWEPSTDGTIEHNSPMICCHL
jgi:hypothetical protein